MPAPRVLARGLAQGARLAVAARLGRTPRVQRRMAERSGAAMLHWYERTPDPIADLHAAERSDWSQHGEDGLLAALLDRVGATDEVFVEIGASDGEENCTRALAEHGWRGYWFEADPERVAHAEKVAAQLAVETFCSVVRASNVVKLLQGAGVPREPDVLVVDIDGNDFWVLREILTSFAPRVVVVEYNATFPPDVFWVRRKRRHAQWDETFRHGASLEALAWLAARSDYHLVACDSHGANAFFLRGDLAANLARSPALDTLYRPLLVVPPAVGHPWLKEPECPPLSAGGLEHLRVVEAVIRGCRPLGPLGEDQLVSILARIENRTGEQLTSYGPTPLRLSAHLLDDVGGIVEHEAERNWIHGGLRPNGDAWAAAVFAIRDNRVATIRLCLVQESVGWAEAGSFDLSLT